MTVKRMDNVGIVVEDIDAAIEFFAELGLELEGRAPIEGDWADSVTGLRGMRVEIAMMRTPDGLSRLEISRFLAPPVVADHRRTPVNALGYLRVMFTVEDIDDTLARLGKTRRGTRRQSVPVRKRVSALLHPGPRRDPDRARSGARAWRLTPPSSGWSNVRDRLLPERESRSAGRLLWVYSVMVDLGALGLRAAILRHSTAPLRLLTIIGSLTRIEQHERN